MCVVYSFPWLQLTRAEVSEEAIHDSGECVAVCLCFSVAIPIRRAGGNNGL